MTCCCCCCKGQACFWAARKCFVPVYGHNELVQIQIEMYLQVAVPVLRCDMQSRQLSDDFKA